MSTIPIPIPIPIPRHNMNDKLGSSRLNLTSLPQYLINAFGDLYKEDGLLVLGRGLGLLPLLAAYIRFVGDAKSYYYDYDDMEKTPTPTTTSTPTIAESATSNKIKKPPLVFVLGLDESERNSIIRTLDNWGTPSNQLPTIITNESGSGKDRATMYNRGGVFIITSRILIVDLLTFVANPLSIEGMFIAHAERVTETSTEAFIIRIYRTQRHWAIHSSASGTTNTNSTNTTNTDTAISPSSMGFVKAFTDDVVKLLDGFAKIDKILKSLYVRKMFLYPRFHISIVEELEVSQPCVEQLHIHLSPLMKDVQNAIAAAVQTCIRELKNATAVIEWNDSELTLDNFVTKSFDYIISKQLRHDWHRLKPTTKQLVSDLRTLRALFQYIIQYDCISFYKLLQNLKSLSASSRYPSMWLLTPAAELLFRKAKERVYTLSSITKHTIIPKGGTGNSNNRRIGCIHPVLEENPKWNVLNQILNEIKIEYTQKGNTQNDTATGGARVLVMVKDNRTLHSLRSYLTEGTERTMTLRWLRYLERFNDRSRAVVKVAGNTEGVISEEARLLLEEESRARHFLFGTHTATNNKRKYNNRFVVQQQRLRKKRNVDKERCRTGVGDETSEILQRSVMCEAVAGLEYELDDDDTTVDNKEGSLDKRQKMNINNPYLPKINHDNMNQNHDSSSEEEEQHYSSSDLDDEIPHVYKQYKIPFEVKKLDDMRIVMRTYGSIQGEQTLLLEDLRPTYIVLYDVDSSFIRSIELYSSNSFHSLNNMNVDNEHDNHSSSATLQSSTELEQRLKVFFMVFEASVEEKTYLKSLEREKYAFERLIQYKQKMPVISINMDGFTQEMEQAKHSAVSSYAGGTLPLSMDTRTGQGKVLPLLKSGEQRRDIAVDVREFRSSLPSILHRNGMRIAPVTLSVGDFILSPVHCVERKSISDLFSSFISGRLYTQAESMCKHYKCPCLLIEFDPLKAFSLQNSSELSGDIRADSVCSKMSLLIMHFPKLRILWSRGPHETVKIFKALKANHEEVNVDQAVEIGRNSTTEASLFGPSDNKEGEDNTTTTDQNNDVAKEMLLRLPGMNAANARKVMSVCSCIADLAKMPREKLKELLGPVTGQNLFTFFRQTLN